MVKNILNNLALQWIMSLSRGHHFTTLSPLYWKSITTIYSIFSNIHYHMTNTAQSVKWMATGWMNRLQFLAQAQTFFSSPGPDHLWDPPCHLSNGNSWLFSWEWSSWSIMLTTHLHLVLNLRICGTLPPISLHDVVLNHWDKISFFSFFYKERGCMYNIILYLCVILTLMTSGYCLKRRPHGE